MIIFINSVIILIVYITMNKLFCGFPVPSPNDFQWQIQWWGLGG